MKMSLPIEHDQKLLKSYRIAARVLGAIVVLLGLALCIGRLNDVSVLSTVSGGTASCFVFAGIAVLLMAFPNSKPCKLCGRIMAFAAGTLSLLNMAHWFMHCDILNGITELPIIPAEAQPLFVLSQNDSVQMVLIAVSLMLVNAPLIRKSPQLAASDLPIVLATLISLMTLLGLIFGVPKFCREIDT
jgi:hypothetical protein